MLEAQITPAPEVEQPKQLWERRTRVGDLERRALTNEVVLHVDDDERGARTVEYEDRITDRHGFQHCGSPSEVNTASTWVATRSAIAAIASLPLSRVPWLGRPHTPLGLTSRNRR